MTKCKIPCNYDEYKLANNPPRPFTDDFGNETVFGLLAVSENTEYQEEVLLYPPSKSENIIQLMTFLLRKLWPFYYSIFCFAQKYGL